MIIITTDATGNQSFEYREDPPEDFTSPEWNAYEAACIEAETNGTPFTPEMGELYSAYTDRAK